MLEKHYQKIVSSKVTGERIGSAPLRRRMKRPQRGRSYEQMFEGAAKRHKEFFDEAERAQKKKTASNVANYNRRKKVGEITIQAGDMALEKDMQYKQKMDGRIGMRYTGPYKVARADGYNVTFKKNGRDRTLSAKNLKAYKQKQSCQNYL